VFDQQQGRNRAFDYINERVNNHIILTKHTDSEIKENIHLIQTSLDNNQIIFKNFEVGSNAIKSNVD
jgi:hypothetical protein